MNKMILFSEILGNDLTQSQITTTVIPPDEEEMNERAEDYATDFAEKNQKKIGEVFSIGSNEKSPVYSDMIRHSNGQIYILYNLHKKMLEPFTRNK